MLHFSGSVPDWQSIAPQQWNVWQRLAARSRGVLTPGNVVSTVGLGLDCVGLVLVLDAQYWWGLGLLTVGRSCDIADGYVAHASGTKSPLGEAVDALCDKVSALLALIVLAAAGVIWWPVALLVTLHTIANSVIGVLGKHRGRTIHPSAAGKFATAGEWVALIGLVLAVAWSGPQSGIFSAAMYGVITASLGLGVYATAGYVRLLSVRTNS